MASTVRGKLDPLKQNYQDNIIENPGATRSIEKHNTALLVIDMQYLDAAEGFGQFRDSEMNGVPTEARRYYFDQLKLEVIPNIKRLQGTFRKHGLEVIHIRIQSLTRDGRDRGSWHKRLGTHAAPGSKEAEFLPEVAPVGDEIIINKTSSGVFNSTSIDYVLRNLGISGLFVTGVYTNECVSTTIRDASDRGYFTTLISDGCAAVTRQLHDSSIQVLRDRFARVLTTDEAIEEVEELAPGESPATIHS